MKIVRKYYTEFDTSMQKAIYTLWSEYRLASFCPTWQERNGLKHCARVEFKILFNDFRWVNFIPDYENIDNSYFEVYDFNASSH